MITDEMPSWLRTAILERRALAEAATPGPWEFEGDDPTDDELFTVHDGIVDLVGQPVAYTRHRQVANGQHMAANDPQDTIARCEAEMGILDLYEQTVAIIRSTAVKAGWLAARDCLNARRELAALEAVVSFLVSGYRFRDGYQQEWRP